MGNGARKISFSFPPSLFPFFPSLFSWLGIQNPPPLPEKSLLLTFSFLAGEEEGETKERGGKKREEEEEDGWAHLLGIKNHILPPFFLLLLPLSSRGLDPCLTAP